MAESLRRPDLLDGDACPVDVGDDVAGFRVSRVGQSLGDGVWLLQGRRRGVKDAPEVALVAGFAPAARERLNRRALTLTDWEKRAVGYDHWSHRDGEPVVLSLITPSPLKMARVLLGQADLADASPRRALGAMPKIEKLPRAVSERQAIPEAQVSWDEAAASASVPVPVAVDDRSGSRSPKASRRWTRRLSGAWGRLSRKRRGKASGSASQDRAAPRGGVTWEFVPPATEEDNVFVPPVERAGREGVAWTGCLTWMLAGLAFGALALLVLWGGVFRWLAADQFF